MHQAIKECLLIEDIFFFFLAFHTIPFSLGQWSIRRRGGRRQVESRVKVERRCLWYCLKWWRSWLWHFGLIGGIELADFRQFWQFSVCRLSASIKSAFKEAAPFFNQFQFFSSRFLRQCSLFVMVCFTSTVYNYSLYTFKMPPERRARKLYIDDDDWELGIENWEENSEEFRKKKKVVI